MLIIFGNQRWAAGTADAFSKGQLLSPDIARSLLVIEHRRQPGLAREFIQARLSVFSCYFVNTHLRVQRSNDGYAFGVTDIFERFGIQRLQAWNEGDARALGHRGGIFERDEVWGLGGLVLCHDIPRFRFRSVSLLVAIQIGTQYTASGVLKRITNPRPPACYKLAAIQSSIFRSSTGIGKGPLPKI